MVVQQLYINCFPLNNEIGHFQGFVLNSWAWVSIFDRCNSFTFVALDRLFITVCGWNMEQA